MAGRLSKWSGLARAAADVEAGAYDGIKEEEEEEEEGRSGVASVKTLDAK